MENITIFLGKIIGPYWLVFGIGFLISTKFYEKQLLNSEKTDSLAVTIQGIIHFYIGIGILSNHFLWNNILAIIITILGFGYLGKGISLIVIPRLSLKSGTASFKLICVAGISFI